MYIMEGNCGKIKSEQHSFLDHFEFVVENLSLERMKPVNWVSFRWTCYYCYKVLQDYVSLKSHVECLHNVINNDINYKCSYCFDAPSSYPAFLNHIRSVHCEDLQLCCDVCCEVLPNFEELSSHRNEHVQAGDIYPVVYHCAFCGFALSSEDDLELHIKLLHSAQDSNQMMACNDELKSNIKIDTSSDDCEADSTLPPPTKKHKKTSSKDPCCSKSNISSRIASSEIYSAENTFVEKFSESILFKKYFKILKEITETGHIRQNPAALVQCCVCNCLLKGSLRITSNFIRHLRLQHSDHYKEYMKTKSVGKIKKQDHFDKLILCFIISNTLPLSIVESSSFKNLMSYANPELCLMNEKELQERIDDSFDSMRHNIHTLLQSKKYFCTAANIWSTKYGSYFAYTCHWFTDKFKRQSFALAYKRIKKPKRFDRIYDMIKAIHSEFGLKSENVVGTVTNNDLDYTKLFKEFGLDEMLLTDEENDIELENIYDFKFPTNISDKSFPKLIRCATHTLILTASTDFISILKENTNNYEKHRNTIQKCCSLWTSLKKSTGFELSTITLGEQLHCPTITRWNSLYESIKALVLHKENLNRLCRRLTVPIFDEDNFQYLEEYIKVMQPLAEAIDFLQQNEHTIFGFILPTLATIRTKYLKICKNSSAGSLKVLATYLISAIEKRFESFYNLNEEANEAIISSVLCPSLKLRWVEALNSDFNNGKSNEVVKVVKSVIAQECRNDPKKVDAEKKEVNHPFFDFSLTDEPASLALENSVYDAEFCSYLANSSNDVNMLDGYPFIKDLYTKFNTPLPSPTAIGKLFACKTLANLPGCSSLSDYNFEKLLLLQINDQL